MYGQGSVSQRKQVLYSVSKKTWRDLWPSLGKEGSGNMNYRRERRSRETSEKSLQWSRQKEM